MKRSRLHWMLRVALVLAVVMMGGWHLTSSGSRADLLSVGSEAPDFVADTAEGGGLSLRGVRGRWAVVFFYPKDATPGCTKEACAFRDAFDRYAQANVVIFGVSRDGDESHARFRNEYGLQFPLVADEQGDVQRAYGVPSRLGMAARVTFLVDPEGRIAKVWPDVDPGVHAEEVLAAIIALRESR